MKKYKVILADPPWAYSNKVSNGAASDHYQTMSIRDIKRIPVWDVAAEGSVLVMWYTSTHVEEAIALADAWGFEVRTMKAFTWVKLNKNAPERFDRLLENGGVLDFHDLLDFMNAEVKINGGNYTRANSEDCLIAVRGRGLERQSMSVRQIVFSCMGEHSEKPKEVHRRIEELYGDVPRLEMFARSSMPGWDCWGNEAPNKAIEFVKGHAVVPFDWKDPSHPMNPNNNLMHWTGGIQPLPMQVEAMAMMTYAPPEEDPVICPGCRAAIPSAELQTGIHICPPVAPESGE